MYQPILNQGLNFINQKSPSKTIHQMGIQEDIKTKSEKIYDVDQNKKTKFLDREIKQQQCRIHVQNPPNAMDCNFPPTETTIHVVQQIKHLVFFNFFYNKI